MLQRWSGFHHFFPRLENKLRQSQRERNRELSKVRNELILMKSQAGAKGKGEVDEMLKSQFDIQKGNYFKYLNV